MNIILVKYIILMVLCRNENLLFQVRQPQLSKRKAFKLKQLKRADGDQISILKWQLETQLIHQMHFVEPLEIKQSNAKKPEKWYVEKSLKNKAMKKRAFLKRMLSSPLSSVLLNLRLYSSIVSYILLRPNWQD